MKFRCDRDALSEALQTVQRGVSSRPGIPALTGVLLEAAEGGSLTLTTTDLEVSARLSVDVQVTEAGTALVPARLLGDTVKSLSDAPVEARYNASVLDSVRAWKQEARLVRPAVCSSALPQPLQPARRRQPD